MKSTDVVAPATASSTAAHATSLSIRRSIDVPVVGENAPLVATQPVASAVGTLQVCRSRVWWSHRCSASGPRGSEQSVQRVLKARLVHRRVLDEEGARGADRGGPELRAAPGAGIVDVDDEPGERRAVLVADGAGHTAVRHPPMLRRGRSPCHLRGPAGPFRASGAQVPSGRRRGRRPEPSGAVRRWRVRRWRAGSRCSARRRPASCSRASA